ncbi:MAG: hypothetical protein HFH14_01795, partial [Lachnospiraceae bacterium]|nr:hypothetical protein [Lachnospiraceae bacterium]
MLKIPLTEQDIMNVKDEYALVIDIWHELERLANIFTQECTDIQNSHKTTTDRMNRQHSVQMERIGKNHAQQTNQLDYERSSALEQWENNYRNERREADRKKEDAKRAKENVEESSSKYRADMKNQIEKRKKQLDDYMDEIKRAEITIAAKKYRKIANDSTELVEINASTLDQLICENPKRMAMDINELDEQSIRKLIHPSLLKSKCIAFYSMTRKAQELYDREIKEQDAILPDADAKATAMVTEAMGRMQNELRKLDADAEQTRQVYINYCLELEQSFDARKEKLLSEQEQEKSGLLRRQENERETVNKNRRDALMNALKKYQAELIHNLPPQVLKQYVESLIGRKIYKAQGFAPAQAEPLNITVGYIYFKFAQFLENKVVKQFMTHNYGFILKSGCFVFPYTIAVNESLALYYRYNNQMAEAAKKNMQTLCLNTFLATPPNKMRFHFIDPLKSGQSFAMFKHFEDENTSGYNIILGGIQTEANLIERQLQIVVDHIKSMQVNTFKGQYKNIREYNAANILNPQPYNIIGIMDFPAGFTEKSIELLRQVVATGKECGVYVIIMACEEQISNMGHKMKGIIANIEQMCNTFRSAEPGYSNINGGNADEDIRYMIDEPLDIKEVVQIAPIMKKGIQDAGRIVIEYENIAPDPDRYLKYTADEGISIPIGLSGASDIQQLNLGIPGSQSVHALICGQIGSGKSRLLHAIVTGALLKYPKEELEIYLVDFKSGTEFKIYADYNLPNFKVIAIESEQEFGLSVLCDIKREGERRAQIFNTCTKSDITSYNNSPDAGKYGRMPRVLIVIDEFHVLFGNSNPDASAKASQIMDGILRLDRSFGFHMVLCSQSIRGMNAINEAAMAQIAVRIALKCPKEDADIVLGEGSDIMEQIEENDAGSAVYLAAISSPKTNNKFRVGYLSPEKHTQILTMLDKHYNQSGITADTRILVSDVSDSRNSVFQKYVSEGQIIAKDRVLHLGEPLKVDSGMEVRFEQSPGNNMLLAGRNTQKAQNILFFITLDLVLQRVGHIRNATKPANIYVINYCDGANADLSDKLQDFGLNEPSMIHYYDGACAAVGMEEVFRKFECRTAGEPDDWLIISNMALAKDIQSGGGYGGCGENAGRFERLLREGPSKGIFCVAWCDDPALFRARFGNTFDYFGKRVVFNMSDEDALAIADVVSDDSINKNNAYFYQNG